MSVQVIVCDACGRMASECECMVEFHKFGMTLHVCDECIDKAKELVEKAVRSSAAKRNYLTGTNAR